MLHKPACTADPTPATGPTARGKRPVLDYPARYAFRIAITNARIVAMDDTHVTFKYKTPIYPW